MQLNELVIEITRRCNAKCGHCLRGGPQRVDISDKTIDKLLEGVDYISTITFSGGEPSLAVDRIRYFTEALKDRHIGLGGFYVITNGKKASLELVHALLDLYAYSDENECSGLVISGDQYHKEVINSTELARALYSGLTFFHPEERQNYMEYIIAEGRAARFGNRPADRNDLVVEVNEDGSVRRDDGVVYINALGDVIPSCNLSYKSQKKARIGNVHDKPIAEILRQWITATVVDSKEPVAEAA